MGTLSIETVFTSNLVIERAKGIELRYFSTIIESPVMEISNICPEIHIYSAFLNHYFIHDIDESRHGLRCSVLCPALTTGSILSLTTPD